MIVVAIVAILASVAIPAYVNHVNRVRRGTAISALMEAKMGQEIFWEEQSLATGDGRYADTIRCLESFGADCSGTNNYDIGNGYSLSVASADSDNYTIVAVRSDIGDQISITQSESEPTVDTPEATGFSVFQWAFGN
jgi:type IV pilus assembly protein PilE